MITINVIMKMIMMMMMMILIKRQKEVHCYICLKANGVTAPIMLLNTIGTFKIKIQSKFFVFPFRLV